MNTKLFFMVALLTAVFSTAVFAQTKFIKITDPAPNDDGGLTYYAYETSIESVKYTVNGKVSSGCKSIRVLWSPDNELAIDEYLYNGAKPITGVTIDDFYLQKYVPGDSNFTYNMSGAFENLAFGSNYYRFIAKFNDGSVKMARLVIYVHAGGAAEKGKPVIYLYPTKKQNIKVNVKPKGAFTTTIPEIGKGWNVTATPDGKIFDKKTNKEYPYLFWESVDSAKPIDMEEGFVVAQKNLNSFLKEKLAYQGLNEKEIADFMEFWEPKLNTSPYVFITFWTLEKINQEAPLTVSPKPDSVIRVYFDYKLLDKPVSTKEQTLKKAERKGFAVVEWGGRLYK